MTVSESLYAGQLLLELSEYFEKYEITFQFWGEGRNSVFVEKDGISLYDVMSLKTSTDAMLNARNYLDKINRIKREYNPNF